MVGMNFYLFSTMKFEIPDPVTLIECFCCQSDFYSKCDVIENRKIEEVNKIGARPPLPVLVVQLILEEKLLSLRGRTKPLPSFRMRATKYPMSWWTEYR